MLLELTVRRLAVIDDLRLRLGPGLNVLTGETGAGKSLLVGALNLALGERAGGDWIRQGEDGAEVEAIFDLSRLPGLRERLAAEDLLDDELLSLRRVITTSGRNRVYLNGRSMPASRLAELGESLVSIFGQHESRGLLRVAGHLLILDEFAGLETEREKFSRLFREVAQGRQKLEALAKRESESAARSDYLRFVVSDIEEAGLRPGEEEELAERGRVLSSKEKLLQIAYQITTVCDEEEDSLSDKAGALLRQAEQARDIDPGFEDITRTVESIAIAAQEASRSAARYLESLEHDPEELTRIDDRLDCIRSLARKYGGDPEAALRTLIAAQKEAAEISSLAGEIVEGEKALRGMEKELAQKAAVLSEKRRKAASRLRRGIQSELEELGIKGAGFRVDFAPPPEGKGLPVEGKRLEERGAERCEFLLSTNPGEPERPLAKIASGGELSRIMLAIKSSLADAFRLPTLVFDEVDAGLGGAQAEIVGRKLKKVAQQHQVLCITHLPQIASLADRHLVVSKKVVQGRATTRVEEVDGVEREKELARMLGGLKVSKAAREVAREMIEGAV